MNKLYLMLCEENIPCEVVKHWTGTKQLYYPSVEANVCDVICFKGSYGYEKGLLEIMGLISDEVKDYDDVEGYLTAKEVFKRIKKHYKENK